MPKAKDKAKGNAYGRDPSGHTIGLKNPVVVLPDPTKLVIKTTKKGARWYQTFAPNMGLVFDETYFYVSESKGPGGSNRPSFVSLK